MLDIEYGIKNSSFGFTNLNMTLGTLDRRLPYQSIRETRPMKQWVLNHLVDITLPVVRILSGDLGSVFFNLLSLES